MADDGSRTGAADRKLRMSAIAGLLAASLMTAGWIVAGLLQPTSYNWGAQEISDLGALTARHAWVWNLADSLSGFFLVLFAFGVYSVLGTSRAGRLGALLIGVVGLGSMLDGTLREDCPLSTSTACQRLQDGPGLSWHHQAHDIESVLVFSAMLLAPFVLARAFGKSRRTSRFRVYSRLTGFALIATTAAYLTLYGENGGGIAQRLIALLFIAWIGVVAVLLLQDGEGKESLSLAAPSEPATIAESSDRV